MSRPFLAALDVFHRPRTKGSLKVYCMKDRRHTVRVEEEVMDSKRFRRAVAMASRTYQARRHGGILRYAGPVEVRMVARYARTMSEAIGSDGVTPWESHATPFPTARDLGDLDKVQRNIGDALAMPGRGKREENAFTSGLILDDSQITDWLAAKRWVRPGESEGVSLLILPSEEGDPWWMSTR